jgi:hypothetical protein
MKAQNTLDCPHCGYNVVKSYGNETKMRSKVVRWDHKGMFAVCKACDGEVPITLELIKSIQSSFVFEVSKEDLR